MRASDSVSIVDCVELPESPDPQTAYRLLPKDPSDAYYHERTDRNIGWITRKEQEILRNSVIGIAGCGGMGGLLASVFTRAGVGEVRIADCETFDVSNINRQFAATRNTVGASKAFTTARLTRAVTDDNTLVVYPEGITEETTDDFLAGCDAVCDEIEFWAVGARILLHERSREAGITVFNCNTVGFGTNIFVFEPDGYTMETCLGLTYAEAKKLQDRIAHGSATQEERIQVRDAVIHGLVPYLPEYGAELSRFSTRELFKRRLLEEQKAPIIATNPPLASGLLADSVLLHLLRSSGVKRVTTPLPRMPEYFHIDAALRLCEVRNHQGDSRD